jgi:hypothetical protein
MFIQLSEFMDKALYSNLQNSCHKCDLHTKFAPYSHQIESMEQNKFGVQVTLVFLAAYCNFGQVTDNKRRPPPISLPAV